MYCCDSKPSEVSSYICTYKDVCVSVCLSVEQNHSSAIAAALNLSAFMASEPNSSHSPKPYRCKSRPQSHLASVRLTAILSSHLHSAHDEFFLQSFISIGLSGIIFLYVEKLWVLSHACSIFIEYTC
jgi:hypothetical protein